MAPENIHMPELMRQTTLSIAVTGVRCARFRLWLGVHIMRLAAAVIGCNVEVDMRHGE